MTKKQHNSTKPLKIPTIFVKIAKFLNFFSEKATTNFAERLFITPIKHKTPKRELEMDANSVQKIVFIPSIQKEVLVYKYGNTDKLAILSHGWSGRGTQLFKIADLLRKLGYTTISFDAPAHGKSKGNTAVMIDFIETILELQKTYGPFDLAVGHSLGAMSLQNAIRLGLNINKLVLLGSGNVVQDILDEFVLKLKLPIKYATLLRQKFENDYKINMDDYSAYKSAKLIQAPTLVIHDNDDPDVNVKASINIHQNLPNGELFLTNGLGHRKILGDKNVIQRIEKFIEE